MSETGNVEGGNQGQVQKGLKSPTQKRQAGRQLSAADIMSEKGMDTGGVISSSASATAINSGQDTASLASVPQSPSKELAVPVTNGSVTASDATSMRASIFSSANKRLRHKIIDFFGVKVEIRQQNLAGITALASEDDDGDKQSALVKAIIRYAFVPGTDEKVFGMEHTEELMSLAYGADFERLSNAIGEMSKIDVGAAEKN